VDRCRPVLQDYIRTATGRDVQIAALRLALWPRPHVSAADVRLMNPPDHILAFHRYLASVQPE
jgi:uncharacterized protein involved in outer membrane biogenesis